jgi:hypothetical protein
MGGRVISVLNTHGELLRKHDCSCAFSGFFPLNNSTFQLTARLDQPIIILDAAAPSGRIAFIPAIP